MDPDDSGTPINLDFTKTFQRGSVALNAGGGYNYTTVSAENLGYYVFYGGGLTADYQFTRRITGDVDGLYEWRDYRDVPWGVRTMFSGPAVASRLNCCVG